MKLYLFHFQNRFDEINLVSVKSLFNGSDKHMERISNINPKHTPNSTSKWNRISVRTLVSR